MPHRIDLRLRPPYTPSRLRTRIKERPMTIAAGFRFQDGILLCADTEQTVGSIKTSDSKIITEQFGDSSVAFAIAGDVWHATSAVQLILQDIRNRSSDEQLTPDFVEGVTRARIEDIYGRLLLHHPRATFSDSPFFDLIAGVYAPTRGQCLLASLEDAVARVTKYACRGVGLSLAEYLIKPMYEPNMTVTEVTALAAYTLSHVKCSVSGCGGDSEFLLMDQSGMRPLRGPEKTEHEDFTEVFDSFLPMIFSYAGDLNKQDADVETVLDAFKLALLNQRKEFREIREKHKASRLKALAMKPPVNA